MSTVRIAKARRLVLYGVSWRAYRYWLRLHAFHRGLRFTYDRGVLEVVTLTYLHESWSRFLCRMVHTITEELNLPVAGGGSTTFRSKKKKRGLEPDECFWLANESRVRGKERLDLRVDPPPDLVIEVDISRSSLDRMAIYGAFGVPEVWRHDGTTLTFNQLDADGHYAVTATSSAFAGLQAADLLPFLGLRGQLDETAIIGQFRTWIRQHLVSKGGTTP